MAVDWLDVARYADSFGFQVDREREMWPWRDWVVRAFNENLPFDQFLTWQLAGDLLPNATDDQILATAFNRLHQQESEGGSVEEEYRVEYVCDRVQTFATAFLGLTFECARCHDHKYDPITQREYYQLFAMFQNIDEAGLYSYFTPSPPTPTLLLADVPTKERLAELRAKVEESERQGAGLRERGARRSRTGCSSAALAGAEARRSPANWRGSRSTGWSRDKLANYRSSPISRRSCTARTSSSPARRGTAVEFTGDDAVDLPLGNFGRHQPFSVSLWLKTPDVKDRAVVFHRSRAWTDAASRGYELLIEDGRLKWSLIHFWPGNAISIAAKEQAAGQRVGAGRGDVRRQQPRGRTAAVRQRPPAATEVIKDNLTKEITGGGGDNIALGERFRDRGFKGGLIDDFASSAAN